MEAKLIAALIATPFALAFVYAGVHEYRRYKSKGSANYGLVYDEETGTSHVSGIAEGQDAYNPEEFDPSNYKEPEIRKETDGDNEPDINTETDPDETRDISNETDDVERSDDVEKR